MAAPARVNWAKPPPPPRSPSRGQRTEKMTLVASETRRPGEPLVAGTRPIRSVPARPSRAAAGEGRRFGRWLLGSALYSLTLGYGTPRSFFAVAPDSWPGDTALGQRLLGGELAGARQRRRRVSPESEDPPWQRAGAAALWLDALNGFAWLRDLRDCGDPAGAALAARLVDDWTQPRMALVAASPGGATCWPTRIVAWIRHYDWLAAAADPGFAARFVFSLGRQRTHLKRALRDRPGRPRGRRRAEGDDLRRPRLPARRQALREEPRADAGAAREVREALRHARRHRGRARAASAGRGAAASARRARRAGLGRAPRAGRAHRRDRSHGADAAFLPPWRRRTGALQRRLGGRSQR